MQEWKEAFKRDYTVKIEEADVEFRRYKSEDKVIYLQQAGSKIFSAVENYLMYKYDKRYRGYQDILSMVANNKDDSQLLTQAVQLHYFFYNGDLHMSRYDAEIIYKLVSNNLKNRLR